MCNCSLTLHLGKQLMWGLNPEIELLYVDEFGNEAYSSSPQPSRLNSLAQNMNSFGIQSPIFGKLKGQRIIMMTLRSRPPSNSQRKIPCQRPNSNFPSANGTVTVGPMRLALICASEFSSP